MKHYLVALCCSALLLGCGDDLADVKAFVQQTKEAYRPNPEPLPKIPEFTHVPYTAQVVRSPFVEPDPELIEVEVAQRKDCLTPDPDRVRHPLESYPMDDLIMRGTLGRGEQLDALIQAQDGKLFRMAVGQHLGLFHGKILAISARALRIEEMVPEGDGCWNKRLTTLELLASE